MEIRKIDVVNAISNNDVALVAEMLEGFNLTKDGTPPHFTSAGKELASTTLSFASAMSYRDDLDSGLAEELIERTAMTVNIFPFVRLVVAAAGIETDGFDAIPKKIREALCKNDYTDKIAYAIEKLDADTFAALLAFLLTGEVEQTHVKFNLPIMRHIHAEETIPEDLMLAYMGFCPRETIDEHFGGLHDALGALSGSILLGSLLGGMHDDDEDEDEDGHEVCTGCCSECHCENCGKHQGGCDDCHRGCHDDDPTS